MRITKLFSYILPKTKLANSGVTTASEVVARHLAQNPEAKNIKPFCQEWWNCVDLKHYRRACGSVTYHGHLNGINHHLTTGVNPQGLNEIFMGTGVTPKEMVQITDAEFKVLPKTKEKIIAYRCIGEKPEFLAQDYARYQKSLKIKKGDIITMPEYAYATSDIGYAEIYLNNKKGIKYTIEIEPESRVSILGHGKNNEIVFPRSSKFECLGTEQDGDVLIVKLKYIKPIDYMG